MNVCNKGVCLFLVFASVNLSAASAKKVHAKQDIKSQKAALAGVKLFEGHAQLFAILAPLLPPNPNILEAGAHNGSDTVIMMNFWPRATIYSFEPVPSLYKQLVERVSAYPKIHTYKLALSDKEGEACFYVSQGKNGEKWLDGSSSLLPPKETLTWDPHIIFPETIKVKTMTIDAWAEQCAVQNINFMWLDMQGYELNALKASPKIFKTVKAVLIEVEFVEAYEGQYMYNDVKQWFEQQGFIMVATDFDVKKPAWFWGNALFVRS